MDGCKGAQESICRPCFRLPDIALALALPFGLSLPGRQARGADLSDRYVLVNLHKDEVQEPVFSQLAGMAANRAPTAPRLGVGVIISYFAYPPERSREQLRRSLDLA